MSAFSIGHLFEAGSSDLLRDHYDDFKENFKALGVEVRNISDDSRLIKSGDLFLASGVGTVIMMKSISWISL